MRPWSSEFTAGGHPALDKFCLLAAPDTGNHFTGIQDVNYYVRIVIDNLFSTFENSSQRASPSHLKVSRTDDLNIHSMGRTSMGSLSSADSYDRSLFESTQSSSSTEGYDWALADPLETVEITRSEKPPKLPPPAFFSRHAPESFAAAIRRPQRQRNPTAPAIMQEKLSKRECSLNQPIILN